MSLEKYRKKRDFDATPEPPGRVEDARPVGTHPTFMIHKHHARRLHYDLRLEIDGALASWAIPQGPSYDPATRRLAVQTEDHPLEYGNFEGRIPDGQYGAGDALIWDRGFYDTIPPGNAHAMRGKGHLDILLLGEKMKGRWHLIRTGDKAAHADPDQREWLFFKAKDELAAPALDIVAERPESVVSGRRITRGPGLASLRERTGNPIQLLVSVWPPATITNRVRNKLPDAGALLFSTAPAGRRVFAAVANGKVALQSEEGRDLAAGLPDLVRSLSGIGAVDCVIDGRLADRRFFPQDLLWLDGNDQRTRPFEERLELLTSLLPGDSPWLDAAPAGADVRWAKRRGSAYGATDSWYEVG